MKFIIEKKDDGLHVTLVINSALDDAMLRQVFDMQHLGHVVAKYNELTNDYVNVREMARLTAAINSADWTAADGKATHEVTRGRTMQALRIVMEERLGRQQGLGTNLSTEERIRRVRAAADRLVNPEAKATVLELIDKINNAYKDMQYLAR